MKIDGKCHCGFISYEAEIDAGKVMVCHCSDCQVLSGSAYRTVVFAGESSFKLLGGEPRTYIKTADSGNRRALTFCPECGSPIYATSIGEGPKKLGIRVGTIRQRAELRPTTQYWCGSALDWVEDLGSLRRIGAE